MSESPRKRTSSLGCLGCLTIPALGLSTTLLVGLLWWLNPRWIDDHASWRAPLVADAPAVRAFPEDDGAFLALLGLEAEDLLPEPTAPSLDRSVQLLELGRVSADYDPAHGGEVSLPNGLRLSVPPGALPRAGRLTLTPVASLPERMGAALAGPPYDVRLGDEEHLEFLRPATLTLPCLPGTDWDNVRLAVWEDERWVPLESTVDAAARTVTAEIEHASIFTTLAAVGGVSFSGPVAGLAALTAAVATAVITSSPTVRGAGTSLVWGFAGDYETPEGNFQFHYERAAVPDDATYRAAVQTPRTSSPVPGVPLFVQDLGAWLEECRPGLERLGLSLAAPRLLRYDVFVSPLKTLGESGPGGPLLLSSTLLTVAAKDGLPLADLMRSVCAHELVHVAQGGTATASATAEKWLPRKLGPARRWWQEMTAEYIANHFWEAQGRPLGPVAERYRTHATLPAVRMVDTEDPDYYSYASMLSLLDKREGAGASLRWILALDDSYTASLANIDAAARQTFSGRGLVDLFREFAFDFYHDDVFGAQHFRKFHEVPVWAQVKDQTSDPDSTLNMRFWRLVQSTGRVYTDTRYRARAMPAIEPLTAQATYVLFDGLPASLGAKLVLRVRDTSPDAADASLFASIDEGVYRATPGQPDWLPVTRALGQLERVRCDGPVGFVRVVEGLGAKGAPNRATLVGINEHLDGEAGSFLVERWLLLPPESVQFQRVEGSDSEWSLDWRVVDLQGDREAFATYRVYQKPRGAADDRYEAVLETTDPHAVVAAEAGREWEFTVRTVDVLGNESVNSSSLSLSFSGTWSGQLRLVRGSLLKPLVDWAERRVAEAAEAARSGVTQESDPARRAELQEEFDADLAQVEELRRVLRPFLGAWGKAEAALRAGVPVSFEIREAGSGYELHLSRVAGLDPQVTDWVPLERVGRDRVRIQGLDQLPALAQVEGLDRLELGEPVLRMHRFDPTGKRAAVIRTDDWHLAIPIEPDGKLEVQVAWEFTRDK